MSKRERNGVFGLLFIILLCLGVYFTIPYLYSPESPDFDRFDKFLNELDEVNLLHYKNRVKMYSFDPNTADSTSIVNAGLRPFLAQNLIKRREKYGYFQNAEDLRLIYGMKDKDFYEILPFIKINAETLLTLNALPVDNDRYSYKENTRRFEFQKFNPNKINTNQLVKMGFTHKNARSIIKYREAIGGFKNEDDLRSSYVINDALFEQMKPFLIWEVNPETKLTKEFVKININNCIADDLQQIQGIGKSRSEMIIKYRNRLGGFVSKDQFFEVYNIPTEVIDRLVEIAIIDGNKIDKIPLNDVDFKTLLKHPYIDYRFAQELMQIRDLLGKIEEKDLVNVTFTSDSIVQKAKPYFSFDE